MHILSNDLQNARKAGRPAHLSHIDSLKVIAKFFHVTIDEMIGGVPDCFVALFLPLFGNGTDGTSVMVFSLTEVSERL